MTVPDLTLEPLIDRLRRATVGRYDVYAELGAGGMATVFLARDLALDRTVAIKVMSPVLMSSPGAIDRFRREARTAAALSHPHIVPIHAIGEEPGIAYYVMKLIEGRTLDSVLRSEGRQEVAVAQTILGYVGGALAYAHQRGVVHRDVKPANIMIDREGWCYVTDFGIAKTDDGDGLTKSGVVIGTPQYMCPEQFNGQPITGAADQYALGVVAYELLVGVPPFPGPSVGEAMRGHVLEPVPSVRATRPEVPAELDACVARMLAKDPADRFPSVADAVEAFGRASSTMERDTRALLQRFAAEGAALQPQSATPGSPVPVRPGTVHAGAVSAPTTPITTPLPGARASAPMPAVASPAPRRRAGTVALLMLAAALVLWMSMPRTEPATARLLPDPSADTGRVLGTADSTPAPAAATPDSTKQASVAAAPERAPDSAPRGGTRTSAPAANPAPTSAPTPATASGSPATIAIGSRYLFAVLYVNETLDRPIGQKGLVPITVPSGRVRLSIRAENCQPWDTTFTALAASVDTIGFRSPRC